ncbi:MAG: D-alanine--D-alanine ligase [Rhodospirillales bacterium]|nr:D-alanine--D-alanine ligase [Rhodospirillales bacterium]
MSKRVAVLMGGWSSEREVSLVSGAAVADGLCQAGYDAYAIDVRRDVPALLAGLTPKPDVVFNALHGRWGEDGTIQGLLDILAIPYTHSGVLASALAMHKPQAKQVLAHAGVPVAEHVIVRRDDFAGGDPMPRPFVIKPMNEGSSVGVRIVRNGSNIGALNGDWQFGEQVMVERFIAGREFTVAVMGDRALAVTEITTERGFYDYDAKYAPGGSRHVVPAQVEPAVYDEAMRLAVLAHQALGCRGVSRADLRWDGERLYMLEVNTQPGMTPTSLVPEQAACAGISFSELVAWMVEHAEYDA